MTAPRRVCFFGTYARTHTTNVVLRRAIEGSGREVVECHSPLWENTRDKAARYFRPASLVVLAARYLRASVELASRALARRDVELFVVGFNGQLDVLLFRLLRRRLPLLFAPLVTITETLVEDRRVYGAASALGRLIGALDRLSLRLPDGVVIDTECHRRYLVEAHRAQPEKVATWYLGADDSVFRPCPRVRREGPLRVLFYGQFLPLHGVRTILEAVSWLASDPAFEFTLVGSGPERDALDSMRSSLRQRLRVIEWVPYQELGGRVADADICLGGFGASAKAQMVIPNKVYQAAAVGRAVLTADSPAIREIFRPWEDIATCESASPAGLADALVRLKDHEVREGIAARGRELMATRFHPDAQADRIRAIMESVP